MSQNVMKVIPGLVCPKCGRGGFSSRFNYNLHVAKCKGKRGGSR